MPCVTIHSGNIHGIVCVRGVKKKCCAYCGKPAVFLCDFPKGKKTCDRPMCKGHAHEVDQDLHQCQEHCPPGLC